MFRTVLASCALLALPVAGHAAILDFEGSTTTGANRQLDVANADAHGPSLINYAGYDWTGMFVAKPSVSVNKPRQITGFELDDGDLVPVTQAVDAGFHRAAVSGTTTAHSLGCASIKARPGEDNFDFFGTYMTSGWRDNRSVTIPGKRDGVTIYTRSLILGDDAPFFVDLDFIDIDEIQFSASGGDFLYANGNTVGAFVNPSMAFSAPAMVFDDMNIATHVPEPASLALFGAGLLALYAGRRRAA